MSFRNIVHTDDPTLSSSASASASASRSSHSGRESSASGIGGGDGGSSGPLHERRRRAPTYVTQNACLNCKKARAKCNGNKPVCSRCASRGLEKSCKYEVHVKTAKEMMVREIKDLKQENNWVEQILRAVIGGGNEREILERLKNGESYQSIAEKLDRPPFAESGGLSPTSQRQLSAALMDYEMDIAGQRDPESGILHEGRWTSITSDPELVEHLFSLYFSWVHPVHMLFSRNHFMSSYRNEANLYCSSSLVNAICAMGCLLLGEKGRFSTQEGLDPVMLRMKFMGEARSLIKPEHYTKWTTIQTFAVMFLVELGQGQGSRASSYIRLAGDAVNSLRDDKYSTEAMRISKWGIYALNSAWGAYTYQVPAVFQVPSSNELPNFQLHGQNSLWRLYRDMSHSDIPPEPSSSMMAASEYASLMRLVHDTTIIYYDGHEAKVKAQGVLNQFHRYLDWKYNLPDDIANIDDDADVLPHVLSLHIQYYCVMVHLFRPLLDLKALPEASMVHIKALTVDNAWRGLEMLRKYRELFTCRYQPSLQNFALLHCGDALVRFAKSSVDATEVVQFCLGALKESADGRGGFSVCGPLQEMFRRTAVECEIPLPYNIADLMGSKQYSADQLLDACSRLSYTQPTNQVVSNFDEDVVQNFAEEWRKLVEADGDDESEREGGGSISERSNTSERFMKIDSVLNE